jgi:hypothetical protein
MGTLRTPGRCSTGWSPASGRTPGLPRALPFEHHTDRGFCPQTSTSVLDVAATRRPQRLAAFGLRPPLRGAAGRDGSGVHRRHVVADFSPRPQRAGVHPAAVGRRGGQRSSWLRQLADTQADPDQRVDKHEEDAEQGEPHDLEANRWPAPLEAAIQLHPRQEASDDSEGNHPAALLGLGGRIGEALLRLPGHLGPAEVLPVVRLACVFPAGVLEQLKVARAILALEVLVARR